MDLLALHIPEQHVGPNRLRNEIGGAQQLLQRLGRCPPGIEEVVPGAEDTHDVVRVLLIDRETGETGVLDGLDDLLVGIPGPEHHHVGAVDHYVLGHGVVEIEDVFDHLFFVRLDGALLLAQIHKGAELILRHRLEPRVRLDAGDAEKRVAESVQRPAKGTDGGGEQRSRQEQDGTCQYVGP